MENIINKTKSVPLSGKDILNLTENKTNIIKYSDLGKFNNIDELLYPHNCIVILYEINPQFGHWVCLIKHKNEIEFFCPYGIFCDDQLKHCYKNTYPYLSKLIYDSGYKFICNNIKIQKKSNDVSTCGRHVAFRVIMKNLSLKEYVNLFKNSKIDPDLQLCYLTAFMK